jgi:hypothetical protein
MLDFALDQELARLLADGELTFHEPTFAVAAPPPMSAMLLGRGPLLFFPICLLARFYVSALHGFLP